MLEKPSSSEYILPVCLCLPLSTLPLPPLTTITRPTHPHSQGSSCFLKRLKKCGTSLARARGVCQTSWLGLAGQTRCLEAGAILRVDIRSRKRDDSIVTHSSPALGHSPQGGRQRCWGWRERRTEKVPSGCICVGGGRFYLNFVAALLHGTGGIPVYRLIFNYFRADSSKKMRD